LDKKNENQAKMWVFCFSRTNRNKYSLFGRKTNKKQTSQMRLLQIIIKCNLNFCKTMLFHSG